MSLQNTYDQFSFDKIMARMAAYARKFWNERGQADLDDPVLNLLLNANAKELDRLVHAFSEAEQQQLSNLANILIPDAEVTAEPAHAVIQARPVSPKAVIKPEDYFIVQNKSETDTDDGNRYEITSIIPTGLVDVAVACKCYGTTLKLNDENLTLARSLPGNQVIVGLEIGKNVSDLSGLSWYVDLPADLLVLSTDYLRLINIRSVSGPIDFVVDDWAGGAPDQKEIDQYRNKGVRYEKLLCHRYANHFLKLTSKEGKPIVPIKGPLPNSLAQVVTADQTKELSKDLVWLQFEFPALKSSSALRNLTLEPNCFPVLHRRLETINPRVRVDSQIELRKLRTRKGGHFLYLHSINDERWSYSDDVELSGISDPNIGRYVIRKRGVEKFNRQESLGLLQNVIDLLREESSVLRFFDSASNVEDLTRLKEILESIDVELAKESREDDHFIIYKPLANESQVIIKYWVTDTLPSDLLPGNTEVKPTSSQVSQTDTRLITRFRGGRGPLSETQSVKHFKSKLLSGDQLITKADIIAFCQAYLLRFTPEPISEIEVVTGFLPSLKPGVGIQNVIRVTIKLPADLPKSDLRGALESELNERSSFFQPIELALIHA